MQRAAAGGVSPKMSWLDEADLVHTPAAQALRSCSFSQRLLQARSFAPGFDRPLPN